MTLRAGTAIAYFHGVIRDDGRFVWACGHLHADIDEARSCARSELHRRREVQR